MLSSFFAEIISSGKRDRRSVVAQARFDGRLIIQRLRAEFAFAGRRAESALRERQERLAIGETFRRTECSRSSRSNVIPSRNGCSESSSVRIMSSSESWKQASSNPMRWASSAEDLDVRFGFAGRRKRGPRQLQMVVAVGEVQVGVLQKRGCGQQDVGVIGGVGLELFQHHCEQILAPHPSQHQVLIGRDGGGIGVVNDHRLHRRMVELGQRLAQLGHIDDARFAAERRTRVAARAFPGRLG